MRSSVGLRQGLLLLSVVSVICGQVFSGVEFLFMYVYICFVYTVYIYIYIYIYNIADKELITINQIQNIFLFT